MSKSNYKRLGDYIDLVDKRNSELLDLPLMGLSISKEFIPSVANIIGTDLRNYKIVYKNQFACSLMQVSRDGKMPIAMLKHEAIIMSPAYPIFEVTDKEVLDPEYLMMWFERKEFDRQAAYYAVGGVRGNLTWEDFCDMLLPVPHIDKQRELVKEYNTIQNRIELNQKMIQKLEETAQAIYRQWFVEFEFPDEEGKPYKSNGGEMVWNEELGKEIPKVWEVKDLCTICDVINGRAYSDDEFRDSGTPIIRIQNLNGGDKYVYSDFILDNDKYVEKDDLIFAWSATFGPFIWRGEKSIYHYHIWKLNCRNNNFKFLLYHYLFRETKRVSGEGSGSIFAHITKSLIESQRLIVGEDSVLVVFHKVSLKIDKLIEIILKETQKLTELKEVLLSKLAKEG